MNKILAAALMTFGFLGAAQAQDNSATCNPAQYKPEQFQVAIDRTSGISFIHSPCGWTYMGVVAKDSIDQDIEMSGAKPVPAQVLQAEVKRQPSLAKYLAPRTDLFASLPMRSGK
jgi:hypothetical protein